MKKHWLHLSLILTIFGFLFTSLINGLSLLGLAIFIVIAIKARNIYLFYVIYSFLILVFSTLTLFMYSKLKRKLIFWVIYLTLTFGLVIITAYLSLSLVES